MNAESSKNSLDKASLDFIDALGKEALNISRHNILSYYNQSIRVEYKADTSPVTEADKSTEAKLRDFLSSKIDCGFVGEEWGANDLHKDFVWIMDPIDGTKSFIREVPLFGTLLACWYKGQPIWGAIDLPALNKQITACIGRGAFTQKGLVRVSSQNKPAMSCLLTGTVNTFGQIGREFSFNQLRRQFGLYRGWGDCFGYFQVLTGRAEVMCDPIVSLWDIGPLFTLFEETGGRFSDLQGRGCEEMVPSLKDWQFTSDSFTGLGSNGLWHKKSLACF